MREQYVFAVDNGKVKTFWVKTELELSHIRNSYGNVFTDKKSAFESLNVKADEWNIKECHLTDDERRVLEAEQQEFAESQFTDEDWEIVKELRAKRKKLEKPYFKREHKVVY